MTCPRCGAVAALANFCSMCGEALAWNCAECGKTNAGQEQFCAACGRANPNYLTKVLSVIERRSITAMFVDLVGSTAIGIDLDPEDLHSTIGQYHRRTARIVKRLGGMVVRYLGDGILVCFGYPKAAEDDAERAVRSSVAVAEAVRNLDSRAGPPGTLCTRIGIATGLVVIGEHDHTNTSIDAAIVGNTLNLAARLQASGTPGSIVIDDATRRLIGNLFTCHNLGRLNLKGFATPVQAWEVVSENLVSSRFEALRPNSQVSFVGRQEELVMLVKRWDQACSSDGQVVLFLGEAGIGKSRLISEFAMQPHAKPEVCIRLSCSPHSQDMPLYPVIRQLEGAAGLVASDDFERRDAKLRNLLLPAGCSDADVALITDLVSVAETSVSNAGAMSLRRKKDLTFAALLHYVAGLAHRKTLMIIIEDVHWADPSTRELLDLLVDELEQLPALMIVSARPEYQPSWINQPHVTLRLLSRLNRRETISLVSSMAELAGGPNLAERVVDEIVARSDGVPLFIEELTNAVVEAGYSPDLPKNFVEPLSHSRVPSSLQASLTARLDRLEASREIAQTGAVIGRNFSFEMLHELSGMPHGQLEEGLGRLVQTGLASVRGIPPDASYTFKHALLQDAAYSSLSRDRRRVLHFRLAEILERRRVGISLEPGLVAWHFVQAGVPERSVDYYLAAARKALARSALAEAISHLRNGLQQLNKVATSDDLSRRELDFQIALGLALIDHQGSGSEGVRIALERARDLCRLLRDRRRLLVVLDALVSNHHFARAEADKMLTYSEEIEVIAQESGDDVSKLWALRMRAAASFLQGRFSEARDGMQRVLAQLNDVGDEHERKRLARDPTVSAYMNLGICVTMLGYPERGWAISRTGLEHAERLGNPIILISALRRACVQGMIQRDTNSVRNFAARLLALNKEYETFVYAREGNICEGWAKLWSEYDAGQLERVFSSLKDLDEGNHWVMLPFFMASVAEVIDKWGCREEAIGLLRRAAVLCRSGEQWCEAEIMRLQARLAAPHSTGELLMSSIQVARKQGAKLWELRSATCLAELLTTQGEFAAAQELLAPIYDFYSEGFEIKDLIAARAAISRAGSSRVGRMKAR